MKQEAVNTSNKPAPSSVTLGRWLTILWQYGVNTPAAELGNEEIDIILARVGEMATEKERVQP